MAFFFTTMEMNHFKEPIPQVNSAVFFFSYNSECRFLVFFCSEKEQKKKFASASIAKRLGPDIQKETFSNIFRYVAREQNTLRDGRN